MSSQVPGRVAGISLLLSMIVVFALTVGYPTWRNNLGTMRPAMTVPAGATISIKGMLWRLRSLDLPVPQDTSADNPPPPNSRAVAFALDRSHDGHLVPTRTLGLRCETTVVDNTGRHWKSLGAAGPLSARMAVTNRGSYAEECGDKGTLAIILFVPKDAVIVGVDVDFLRSDGLGWKEHRIVRFSTPS